MLGSLTSLVSLQFGDGITKQYYSILCSQRLLLLVADNSTGYLVDTDGCNVSSVPSIPQFQVDISVHGILQLRLCLKGVGYL